MFKKFINYLYQVAEEFKKIKYPEKKEIITMSIGVLVAIFVIGLFCLSIDWLFITFINWAVL
jgi:preprotein translocase SecE subunit